MPVSQLTREELDELANFKPSLTYGQQVQAPPEDFIPAHVGFDKKVLLFLGYFKQTVHESADEYYRVRPVKIYYYLEDDSIAVIEPAVENRYCDVFIKRFKWLIKRIKLSFSRMLDKNIRL